MRGVTRLLLTGLAAVTLAGCVEFEKQTLLVRYDAETDVLTLRLVYEGIYGGDENVEKDRKDLKKAAESGTQFFLLDNWPFGVDLALPEEGEKDDVGIAMLRPHAKVSNGTFFLNPDGKLSAWQDVTFTDVTKLLTKANQLLSLAVVAGKVDGLDDADEATKLANRKLALSGHQWLRVDKEGLHLEFAASRADMVRMRRGLLDEIVKDARKPVEKDAAEGELSSIEVALRILSENDISFARRGDRVKFTLYAGADGLVRGVWWNRGRYVANLMPAEGEASTLPLKLDREKTLAQVLESMNRPAR